MTPAETIERALNEARADAFREARDAQDALVAFSAIDRVAAAVAAAYKKEELR